MLFIATSEPLEEFESEDLSIQALSDGNEVVTRHFSHPHVRFIGSHTDCSCGFPSVIADDGPLEYFEGMFGDEEDDENRLKNLRSVRAPLETVRACLTNERSIELFPVWAGMKLTFPLARSSWRLESSTRAHSSSTNTIYTESDRHDGNDIRGCVPTANIEFRRSVF
jgi:hypothetical protein